MSIKEVIKKNQLVRNKLIAFEKKLVAILVKLSPVLATKYIYKRATGKSIDLNNPKSFNEKVQWLKLYWQHPLVVQCADKYEVRAFIKERHCEENLNPLYGVYNDTSEIDWDKLPEKFVLKTTNGCGTNIICKDKDELDKEEVFTKLNKWLKTDYSLQFAEIHYSKMTPRIICEKYIETEDGLLPNDYKVFCFNGEPKFILAINERETGTHQRYFFDLNWNLLEYEKKKNISKSYNTPRKPKSLSQMIDSSLRLSEGFPFVRVDFYDGKNKPIFGEMTFTPVGGLATYYKDDIATMLGEWIELPEKIR